MADERITIRQKVVIADGAQPCARVGDVIAHGETIPANVVRFRDSERDDWRRVSIDPPCWTFLDADEPSYDHDYLTDRPRWWPVKVVEVDPEPQPYRDVEDDVHYYVSELRPGSTFCGIGLEEDNDLSTTDEPGKATCDTCRAEADEDAVAPLPPLSSAWLREAIERWMPDQWRQQAIAVLLSLHPDEQPAESGPLVLTLPEVPKGASLYAGGTRFDLDTFGQWTTQDGSWSGTLAGIFAEFADDGSVVALLAPPREPRTWPKIDPAPDDLPRALDLSLHPSGSYPVRWVLDDSHEISGMYVGPLGNHHTLPELRAVGWVTEVLT